MLAIVGGVVMSRLRRRFESDEKNSNPPVRRVREDSLAAVFIQMDFLGHEMAAV